MPHIQRLLAQHLRNILVGRLLVAAQIQQRVSVAQQSLPVVLEQCLQTGYILQDDGGHDIAGTHGALYLYKIAGQRHVAELVHHQPHRNRQRPLMHLIRLIIQRLERAGIEHPHQIVKGAVTVGDNRKDRLFALPHHGKLHFVLGGDVPNLRYDEGRQPHRSSNEDGTRRFACGLLKNMVFPHRDVVRLLVLQRLKQQIQRRTIRLVLLACTTVLQHIQHRFKILFLRWRFIEQVQHQGSVQRHLRTLPERVALLGVLGCGVLDQVVYQLHHVLGVPYVGEGVERIGVLRVDEVEYPQHISLLQQQRRKGAQHFSLGICHKEAAVGLHNVGLAEKPRLTGAAAAHDDL